MSNDNEDFSNYLKIALIGSVSVGKTSIVNRFIKNIFDEKNKSTSGANYSKKIVEVNNQKISLDIWDTAGQERFRSLGRHFYKNANMIIIVYDITNLKSFQDIENFWYDDIKENGEEYKVIAIVGNKFDLYDREEVEEINDKMVEEYIDKLNNDNKCKFFHMKVSAKTGVNVKPLFIKLVSEYLTYEPTYGIKPAKTERIAKSFNINKVENQKTKSNHENKCCG